MARVPTEIIEILREPDLLADMHVVAERKHTLYVINHVLICQLAKRAFGFEGEAYASLGAGVQEIVADFSELETPQPTVVATTHAVSALSATPDRATDLMFDTMSGSAPLSRKCLARCEMS